MVGCPVCGKQVRGEDRVINSHLGTIVTLLSVSLFFIFYFLFLV